MKNILVTGSAGFIGAQLVNQLIKKSNNFIVGLDNMNSYYAPSLKKDRVSNTLKINDNKEGLSKYVFIEGDITNKATLFDLFENYKITHVVHLAAQAGVRYSIENPHAYIDSNIIGFMNMLEVCRHHKVEHLVYASSSSVYGKNTTVPFSESDSVDHPVSLYAATKKANELMAHTYSELYGIPTTGLRFFTVYGPWGRPDMSPMLFADAITEGRAIKVFNHGNMLRDFTYVDDIVEGIIRLIDTIPIPDVNWDSSNPNPSSSNVPYRIYNIGNSQPIKLMDFISLMEQELEIEAIKEYLPMQPGDVYQTNADTSRLESAIGYKPSTSLSYGVKQFVKWYKQYYKK